MKDTVTILGTRGSAAVSGAQFHHYGGSTTCVLAQLAGQTILLDAGTGIYSLPEEILREPELHLLLTHLHLDHIQGLPLFRYLLEKDAVLHLYVPEAVLEPFCKTDNEEAFSNAVMTQLERVFSPPVWPVSLQELPAKIQIHRVISASEENAFSLGPVRIQSMPGRHPGGVLIYKLTFSGKSIVLATDCTLSGDRAAELPDFAKDCDLLLCDGQYDPQEWEEHRNFGHSTWQDAASLGAACKAKNVRIIHHDPSHTDTFLKKTEDKVRRICPACAFAREGEKIIL